LEDLPDNYTIPAVVEDTSNRVRNKKLRSCQSSGGNGKRQKINVVCHAKTNHNPGRKDLSLMQEGKIRTGGKKEEAKGVARGGNLAKG